jgi:hypothetical protein
LLSLEVEQGSSALLRAVARTCTIGQRRPQEAAGPDRTCAELVHLPVISDTTRLKGIGCDSLLERRGDDGARTGICIDLQQHATSRNMQREY